MEGRSSSSSRLAQDIADTRIMLNNDPSLQQACESALPTLRRALMHAASLQAVAIGEQEGWYYKDER